MLQRANTSFEAGVLFTDHKIQFSLVVLASDLSELSATTLSSALPIFFNYLWEKYRFLSPCIYSLRMVNFLRYVI